MLRLLLLFCFEIFLNLFCHLCYFSIDLYFCHHMCTYITLFPCNVWFTCCNNTMISKFWINKACVSIYYKLPSNSAPLSFPVTLPVNIRIGQLMLGSTFSHRSAQPGGPYSPKATAAPRRKKVMTRQRRPRRRIMRRGRSPRRPNR